MSSDRKSGSGRAVLAATATALVITACSGSTGEASSLVTNSQRNDDSPANAASISLTVPQEPAEPWCLLSDGALVVWPEGSTYDVAAGEVSDESGRLLGKVGESVEGGGLVEESPSSDTLEKTDWAGCTPTDTVLHQYG